jgi:hypothetical protein
VAEIIQSVCDCVEETIPSVETAGEELFYLSMTVQAKLLYS